MKSCFTDEPNRKQNGVILIPLSDSSSKIGHTVDLLMINVKYSTPDIVIYKVVVLDYFSNKKSVLNIFIGDEVRRM